MLVAYQINCYWRDVMRFIEAKQILSSWSSGDGWFGTNYGMNIYKGCCHGCIYCDSRSECYHVDNFDEVRSKKDVLLLLQKELKSKRKKGIIGAGSMSDPYNPFEKEYKLSRGALELINKYGFGTGVITKSDLILRDIDLFQRIKEHSPSMANMTITTYDDELCRKIEPKVTVTSKRFEVIRQLSRAGIFSGVLIGPILPFINDTEDNIRGLIKEAANNGARFVYPFLGVTLRQNQRLYFYEQLDKLFPGIKHEYIKTFGDSYECRSLNSQRLWKIVKEDCEKYKLLYKMPDIIAALKYNYEVSQISFF
jgi:DNA repair photolyase